MDLGEKYHVHGTRRREEYIKKRELDPDEEVTLSYAPVPAHKRGINAQETSFKSKLSDGLNKTASVFDRTAVFHTNG